MTDKKSPTREIFSLLDKCSDAEKMAVLQHLRQMLPVRRFIAASRGKHSLEEEWGVSAETILDAIARSPDLTLRGIRGIIAEAIFERFVVPTVPDWRQVASETELPYDFLLRHQSKPDVQARVQVKLQRLEKHVPKLASRSMLKTLKAEAKTLYVVEVQKTRMGKSNGEDTRPYRFGDFDILAVCMHPSTGDWQRFSYTLASWLLPRQEDRRLIQIMQPVASEADECWTDNLRVCLDWYLSGVKKRLYQ